MELFKHIENDAHGTNLRMTTLNHDKSSLKISSMMFKCHFLGKGSSS
jgi:hypothetical protein